METIEDVAVSTRVRLARNFAGIPFPNRLKDRECARRMIHMVAQGLRDVEAFRLDYMDSVSEASAASMYERNLISRELIRKRDISAVLASSDENISVMINEEDHIRAQYFLKGLDLEKAYERLAGIEEIISETMPFAYDKEFGYLTACPSNLGTGLRASVMLFLPALAQSGYMRELVPILNRQGLTVRGSFGEGSATEGALYQVSNEVTLGYSEAEILARVGEAVTDIIVSEHKAREKMFRENRLELIDTVLRSYGVLTNCIKIGLKEFIGLMTNVKLGVALGILEGNLSDLDEIIVSMHPAALDERSGETLSEEMQNICRAEYTRELLGSRLGRIDERRRIELSGRE